MYIKTSLIVNENVGKEEGVCIYARVSSAENRDNLDSQAERLKEYCIAKGYRTFFCARIYGMRRSKRKTERIIEELRDGE